MSIAALRRCSAAALAALAAGCGGADEYANLNADSASQQAMDALASEVNAASSPLYHHRLELVSATKARDPSGVRAWDVKVADRTSGATLCVYAWMRVAGIATIPTTDITVCGTRKREPAPRPATTSGNGA